MNRITTEHDFLIEDLFKSIFSEIKKINLTNGFPYVEHDIGKILYHPNYEKDFIENIKALHSDNDKNLYDIFYDIPHQDVILNYVLMITNFNHDYPVNLPYRYNSVDDFKKRLQKYMDEIFEDEFLRLPFKVINNKSILGKIDLTNPKTQPIHDEMPRFFKDFKGLEGNVVRRVMQEDPNIKSDVSDNLIALAEKMLQYEKISIYPYDYETIENYDEKVLIYSDVIRLLHINHIKIESTNISGDKILPPFFERLKEDLEEHDIWQEFVDYAYLYSDDIVDVLSLINIEEIKNQFELLMMVILHKRYKTIDNNFEKILQKTREELKVSPNLTDLQMIQYLIQFYQSNVGISKRKKIVVFKGVKLTEAISDKFVKILILLLKKKESEYNGTVHEYYTFNPNEKNISFEELIFPSIIPTENNKRTCLNAAQTNFLMLLLADRELFLNDNKTLLKKATQALTGYSHKQMENDMNKIIESSKKFDFKKIKGLLREMIGIINDLEKNK